MSDLIPVRTSGKSNQQVVIELVRDKMADALFTYLEIASALADDNKDHEYSRRDVQKIVGRANHQLLREHQRCLRNVPGVGYRIAFAREHAELAGHRTRKSSRQLCWALETMVNVKLDEMNEQEKALHIAQQVVNGQLYANQLHLLREQEKQRQSIRSLTDRLDKAGI